MSTKLITLTDEVIDGLDRFIAAQEVKQDRDQAVNALLADWLTREGIYSRSNVRPRSKPRAGASDCR